MKHVHADSLKSVFTDDTLSIFTETAKQKGVDYNSIIYIKCSFEDLEFGDKFTEGSTWIWEHGVIRGNEITADDLYDTDDDLLLFSNQVKSDWEETNENSPAFIKNKPEIIDPRIPIIDKTTDSNNVFAINANTYYLFGQRTSLNITLNDVQDTTIYNEYLFSFISGNPATSLVLPNTIKWIKVPEINKNSTYVCSIENNLGIIGEWKNE